MSIPLGLGVSITGLISILVVVLFLLWYFKIRKVLNVRILREYGDIFKIVMSKKLPFNTETFSYRQHSYIADTTVSILDGNNNPTLYYLQEHAKPIHLIPPKGKQVMDSRVFKTTLESNEYDNMMRNPRDKFNTTMFLILVCICIGLAGIMMYREISHSNYVIELIKNQTQTLPPVTGG